jgi:hypothetical protein
MHRQNRLIAIASILALAATASAQVSTYQFTQTAGTYVPITGGTQISQGSPSNTLDDATFAVTLPFGFNFDGAVQTAVQVQTNGHLAFGGTSPGTTYTPMSSTAVTPGFIAACGRDLQSGYVFAGSRTIGSNQVTNANLSSNGPLQVGDFLVGTGIPAGTTVTAIAGNVITMSANATTAATNTAVTAYGPWSELRHETLGTSPNQVFVVQWSGFRRFSTTLTTNQDVQLNFQIRLHEATGVIEAVYGTCTPGVSTTTALHQVGLRGPNNTFPLNVNLRQNTKGVNDDWANSAAGASNASGMLFNNVAPANVIASGLTYTWTPQSGIPSSHTSYGAGCYNLANDSFYDYQATSAAGSTEFSNTSVSLVFTGTGYAVSNGSAAYVAPTGGATVFTLTDDSEVVTPALTTPLPYVGGAATALTVCSNGFVSVASGNGQPFLPVVATMLAAPQTAWWAWHDCNPAAAGSGAVKFEEVGGIAYITWDGVYNFGGTTAADANTMQFQFDEATGNVNIVFGTLSVNGNGWLAGYSTGGPNLDPGSISFGTALPILTSPDVNALTLSAAPNPVLGATVIYTTSNIPPTALVSADLISLGQINPGIDLGFMGAAGCFQLVDLSLAATTLLFGGPSATLSFSIPNDPGLSGLPLNVQSASLDLPSNALGVITSNGVRSIVGDF